MDKPVLHHPDIEPVAKMDTPVGLFHGTCSCGWKSTGLESEKGAKDSALQHAKAKNSERMLIMARAAERLTVGRMRSGINPVVVMSRTGNLILGLMWTPLTPGQLSEELGWPTRSTGDVDFDELWPYLDGMPGLMDGAPGDGPVVSIIQQMMDSVAAREQDKDV